MPNTPKETVIRGVVYPSRQAAADALKLSPQAIGAAIREKRLDTVGLKPIGRSHGKRITFEGVEYRSIWQASKETGVPYSTLRECYREHV